MFLGWGAKGKAFILCINIGGNFSKVIMIIFGGREKGGKDFVLLFFE